MDKRDIKEYFKTVSIIYGIMFGVVALPINIIISIIGGLINGNVLESLINNTLGLFMAIFALGVFIYGIFAVAFIMQKLRRDSEAVKNSGYVRELPDNFPPAIASLIYDNSIEVSTDYTATIAYLLSKQYIEINEETEEVYVLKDEFGTLSVHEQYALNCLLKRVKFDSEDFKKRIVDDAKKMNLIEYGKRKIHFVRNICIAIACMMFLSFLLSLFEEGTIIYNIVGMIGFISEMSIFAVIGYSIYLSNKYHSESYYRTDLGNVEAKRWAGVKNFIHDYTLLSERELKDTVLFDNYIPYSIALNEAKAIEKYIETNDKYRKIIYGKVTNIFDENKKEVY